MHDRSQTPIQPLLTPEQVASIFGLTRLAVIRATRSGRIPGVRIGKVWRYRPESIQAWLDEQAGAA
jgi:excisionase family DNA binding protein